MDNYNIEQFLGKVNNLFSDLNTNNVTTETDFTCCSSCGHTEIKHYMNENNVGYVFYSIGDHKLMENSFYINKQTSLKVTCGVNNMSEHDFIIMFESLCKKNGLKYSWNDAVNNSMQIMLT